MPGAIEKISIEVASRIDLRIGFGIVVVNDESHGGQFAGIGVVQVTVYQVFATRAMRGGYPTVPTNATVRSRMRNGTTVGAAIFTV